MKRIKIMYHRAIRKDAYLPKQCNSNKIHSNYLDQNGCDCKIWCKYPLPGMPAVLTLDIPLEAKSNQPVESLLKTQKIYKDYLKHKKPIYYLKSKT